MWKSIRLLWAAVLLAIAFAAPAAAQESPVRSFTTADGLPSDQVLAVVQSADGRLWVGTTRGLRHLSGSSFSAPDNMPAQVSQGWVSTLLATPNGTLWIGADSGLHRRNPDGSWDTHLEEQAGLQVDEIRALYFAQDSAVWVGGFNGLARWDGRGWETVTIDGLPPPVKALAEDAQGHLWVATLGPTGSSIRILQGRELIKTIDSEGGLPAGADLKMLQRDSNGDMWAATDGGLVQFSGSSVQRVYDEEDGLSRGFVWTVIEHHERGLWVGTTHGLNYLSQGVVKSSLTGEDGLAGNSVNALSYDAEGNLWLGTNAGLSRLSLGSWSNESHPLLQFTEIKKVLPGPNGDGYAITPAGVVYRTPDGDWMLLTEGLLGDVVYTLARDTDGRLWAGTNVGLTKLEHGRFEVDTRVPTHLRAAAILFDSHGNSWVGTNEGLFRLSDQEVTRFSKATGQLGQNSVLALWETKTGDIWVGTLNGGASRYRNGTWTLVNRATTNEGLVDDVVIAGLEDSAGHLWFATTDGASRLQAKAAPDDPAAWRTFRVPNLAGEQVNALWEDIRRPGNIWVGTEGGLNLISGDRVSQFTRDDGLSHKWINALGQAPDGTLWIGTDWGLTYHRDAQQAPRIKVRSLLVDNEVCDATCQTEGVPYRSETATFQYDASDLADLDGLQYLVSIQAGELYTQIQTSDTSTIHNLIPGIKYSFSVQAFDRDFNYSSKSTPVPLFVKPPSLEESVREWRYLWPSVVVLLVAVGLVVLKVDKERRRRQLFVYPLDLEVSLSASDTDKEIRVQLRGFIRERERLNIEYTTEPRLDCIGELETQLRKNGSYMPKLLQDLGERLFTALFSQEAAAQFQGLRLGRLGREKPTRLRLRLDDAPQLMHSIPWEFAYEEQSRGHLAIDSQVALVRDLSSAETTDNLSVQSPLKVLIAWANPEDERRGIVKLKRLEEEVAAIKEVLRPFEENGSILVNAAPENGCWPAFEQAVRTGYDLVHFTGHGGIWKPKDPGGHSQRLTVLWFDDGEGAPEPIDQEQLVKLLGRAPADERHKPKLVVLNACRTDEQEATERMLGLAEALVRSAKLPAAIGMGYPIPEDAALIFSKAFYQTLVDHGQVDHAVMVGRKALANQVKPGFRYWGVPRLFSRVRRGVVFDLIK